VIVGLLILRDEIGIVLLVSLVEGSTGCSHLVVYLGASQVTKPSCTTLC